MPRSLELRLRLRLRLPLRVRWRVRVFTCIALLADLPCEARLTCMLTRPTLEIA